MNVESLSWGLLLGFGASTVLWLTLLAGIRVGMSKKVDQEPCKAEDT